MGLYVKITFIILDGYVVPGTKTWKRLWRNNEARSGPDINLIYTDNDKTKSIFNSQ